MSKTFGQRAFHFKILSSGYEVAIERLSADEAISQCYGIDLWLVSEDQILASEVVEKEGLLRITGTDEDRWFHGVINKFSLSGQNGRFNLYEATVVPYFWFLSLNSDYRIFQEKTVVEIAEELLKARAPHQHFESRLTHKYEKRRYCVQFGESDWRFMSRILEEEGIFYFFQHFEDKHVLVLADDKIAYATIPGDTTISYHPYDALVPQEEVISSFVFSHGVTPGKVASTNYNFKRPTLDLATQQQSAVHQEREVFEYPGNYGFPETGNHLAKVRLQEKETLRQYGEGMSNCPRLAPGHALTMAMHHFEQVNREYVVVSAVHQGTQSHVLGEQSGIGGDSTYSNDFLIIPSDITLRPERLLKKPYVRGLQTAMVVGPPGEEIFPDEYGRVKVRFHWDREGRKDDKSSCWLRISQPWSGQSWGMIALPRVGDEVLVDFINGDPDWPIVVGSVNNAGSPALYPLPANKTQSGIRTRSYPNGGRDNFHELRFEDKKGCEHIYLQSERDWNILVKNDKSQQVGHDEALEVTNNRMKTVGVDQVEQVGRNASETVGANQSISVGANKTESVAINSAETVGLAKELTVGGAYQVSVAGVMNETVLGAKAEEVGVTKQVLVGSHMVERVDGNRSLTVGEGFSATVSKTATVKAKTIILDADEEIVLKCGGATISLKADGSIVLDGASCTQNASGEIVIKGARTSVN